VFEVGFSELLLIAVIGLLVLGPERLPTAVRTGSILIGRLRRQFSDIRAEVERELGADEIRAQLHNERIMDELRESRAALESAARDLRAPLVPPATGAGAAPAAVDTAPAADDQPAAARDKPAE
jgi:sec-independent protein translocase protein TatB